MCLKNFNGNEYMSNEFLFICLQKKPPEALLKLNKILNVECLEFYAHKTFTRNSLNQHDLFKITNAPICMDVMDIKSHCVYVSDFIKLA